MVILLSPRGLNPPEITIVWSPYDGQLPEVSVGNLKFCPCPERSYQRASWLVSCSFHFGHWLHFSQIHLQFTIFPLKSGIGCTFNWAKSLWYYLQILWSFMYSINTAFPFSVLLPYVDVSLGVSNYLTNELKFDSYLNMFFLLILIWQECQTCIWSYVHTDVFFLVFQYYKLTGRAPLCVCRAISCLLQQIIKATHNSVRHKGSGLVIIIQAIIISTITLSYPLCNKKLIQGEEMTWIVA